ncbi:MAG: 30S ribosomal protein S24e [Thermoproteota archaeon]|nr:30S ribosomal protein S24e [Thermoproteota archaeon]
MKKKVVSEEYNPLLKRKEVIFKIEHEQTAGTPPRLQVRKMLAKLLKTNIDVVYIKKMETKTGTMTTVGTANVYDSVEQAKLVEPEYIIMRNIPPEKPEKEKTEKEEKQKE